MQIDRLFMIVQILVNKGKVTAKELAERFEVSSRTIYRDVDTLSLNGIPIYTSKGKGGGIHILDDYVMDKSVLSKEEQNSLVLGLETLKATKAEDVTDVIDKMKGIFNHQQSSWLRVDFSRWSQNLDESRRFDLIKQALTTNNVVAFDYYNARGEKKVIAILCPCSWFLRKSHGIS